MTGSDQQGNAIGDCLKVAVDVHRLFQAIRLRQHNLGITRYTRSLVAQLRLHPTVEFVAVVYGGWDPLDAKNRPVIAALEEEVGPVSWLWTNRPLAEDVDVYLSPVYALPPRELTGNAVRVVVVHDVLYVKFPELFPVPGGTPAIVNTLASIDLDRDYAISVSERTSRDLLSVLALRADHASVVREASDDVFFAPDPAGARSLLRELDVEPREYLLMLGQLEARKNLDRQLRAVSRVLDEGLRFKLLVVTEIDKRAEVESLLQAAGLESGDCRIAVGVDDETLGGLYSQAICLLYVPLCEGFGLPPLEAMAAGCPAVVSPVGAITEVVGDSGIYANPESVDSICDGIRLLVHRSGLREGLRARGRSRALSYRWDDYVESILQVLRRASNDTRERVRAEGIPPAPSAIGRRRQGRVRAVSALFREMVSSCKSPEGALLLVSLAGVGYAATGLPLAGISAMLSTGVVLLLLVLLSVRLRRQARRALVSSESVESQVQGNVDQLHHELVLLRREQSASLDAVERAAARYSDASRPDWRAVLDVADEIRREIGSLRDRTEKKLVAISEMAPEFSSEMRVWRVIDEEQERLSQRQAGETLRRLESELDDRFQAVGDRIGLVAAEEGRVRREVAADRETTAEAVERLQSQLDHRFSALNNQVEKVLAGGGPQVAEAKEAAEGAWSSERLQRVVAVALRDSEARLSGELAALEGRTKARLETEQALRISDFARLDRNRADPEILLLLLTIHRCGSTWLLDLLRSHPRISLEPTARFHEQLGLEGRRYPVALSNPSDRAGLSIEVHPGRGSKIPALALPADLSSRVETLRRSEVAVEKIHASFFEFDAERLVDAVERLEGSGGPRVKFIYLVRDPREAIVSFLRYRRRDPNWSRDVSETRVANFVRRSFETVADVVARRPGPVLLYGELLRDPVAQLIGAYEELWPGSDRREDLPFARAALQLNSRERVLARQSGAFLEDQSTEADDRDRAYLAANFEEVEACVELARRLLDSRINSVRAAERAEGS